MKTINASCSCLTEHIARVALRHSTVRPASVSMPPEQLVSTSLLFKAVAIQSVTKLEDIPAIEKLAKEYQPTTLMGIPIVVDESMPSDRVELRDSKGEILVRIEALAIPIGCDV